MTVARERGARDDEGNHPGRCAVYDVVVLVEQPVSRVDARQIADLHAHVGEPRHYHVLIPIEDAASRVEAAIGSIAASEVLATSALYFGAEDIERIRREVVAASREALDASIEAFRAVGVDADGEVTASDPLDRLAELVAARGSREVVILTRPHLVAQLLHVDWTSKARKRLAVPCVHLLAHEDAEVRPGTG